MNEEKRKKQFKKDSKIVSFKSLGLCKLFRCLGDCCINEMTFWLFYLFLVIFVLKIECFFHHSTFSSSVNVFQKKVTLQRSRFIRFSSKLSSSPLDDLVGKSVREARNDAPSPKKPLGFAPSKGYRPGEVGTGPNQHNRPDFRGFSPNKNSRPEDRGFTTGKSNRPDEKKTVHSFKGSPSPHQSHRQTPSHAFNQPAWQSKSVPATSVTSLAQVTASRTNLKRTKFGNIINPENQTIYPIPVIEGDDDLRIDNNASISHTTQELILYCMKYFGPLHPLIKRLIKLDVLEQFMTEPVGLHKLPLMSVTKEERIILWHYIGHYREDRTKRVILFSKPKDYEKRRKMRLKTRSYFERRKRKFALVNKKKRKT
jgi:hypothetical protein